MANKEVKVPDIGGATDVEVIEILVKPGDEIATDDSIITLESEKASMEVPAPFAGKVKDIKVKIGDKVEEGALILTLDTAEKEDKDKKEEGPKEKGEAKPEKEIEEKEAAATPKTEEKVSRSAEEETKPEPEPTSRDETGAKKGPIEKTLSATDVHAGPGVRRYARELGVDLSQVSGSGRKDRILLADVQAHVKARVSGAAPAAGFALPAQPSIDFSQFGPIETQPLSKIKRLTGVNVHRSWVTVPHVTQFDEADITEMEAFRQANKKDAEAQGFNLTPLVFLMKAAVAGLKRFPAFNSSLDPKGDKLILKKYFHMGVAVDTPNGLVVPVIRDVDQKGLFQLAEELAHISKKAREKGLMPNEMQGSCFTISSLGGIGGTAFTPIVNMPDVAILGVSRAKHQPVLRAGEFVPRLMLPFSLSYDHRVIDGAQAARFTTYLANVLMDVRRLLL